MTTAHTATWIAGFLGASGVGLGAFGAHALKTILSGQQTTLWQTASLYHLLHAVALAAVAALLHAAPWPAHEASWRPLVATLCVTNLAAGTVLFSGSLYALALGAPRGMGAVTPLGGLLLMGGWLMLGALGFLRS